VVTTGVILPGAVSNISLALDVANSKFITITNDVPAVHAGSSVADHIVFDTPPDESFTGYYPTDANLIYSTTTSPLGGGGTELNFGFMPVQYNHDTHTTKIWTHLVFDITYNFTADSELSSADSDADGIPDWWEAAHGTDPYSALGDNGAAGDPDQDGLSNLQEFQHGTDPQNPDTDRDGFSDGVEVSLGTNPLNPGSVPQVIYMPIIIR
jgi:Bacterial TSP3 repeat